MTFLFYVLFYCLAVWFVLRWYIIRIVFCFVFLFSLEYRKNMCCMETHFIGYLFWPPFRPFYHFIEYVCIFYVYGHNIILFSLCGPVTKHPNNKIIHRMY